MKRTLDDTIHRNPIEKDTGGVRFNLAAIEDLILLERRDR